MSKHSFINKPIGQILEEAGLINSGQVHVALIEQSIYSHLKLGEILALHGWIDQQTADFFGNKIKELIADDQKKQIGNYFFEAGLIKENDIQAILDEQKKLGVKFGSLAVLRGCITQDTLRFFLKYFAPDATYGNEIQYQNIIIRNSNKTTIPQNIEKVCITSDLPDQNCDGNSNVSISEETIVHNYENIEVN